MKTEKVGRTIRSHRRFILGQRLAAVALMTFSAFLLLAILKIQFIASATNADFLVGLTAISAALLLTVLGSFKSQRTSRFWPLLAAGPSQRSRCKSWLDARFAVA